MVCPLFDCGTRSRCAPLNPCGYNASNPYFRAANEWLQGRYTDTSVAGTHYVCGAACKWVDYKVSGCCLPRPSCPPVSYPSHPCGKGGRCGY